MIDLHTHVAPGIDDGAQTMDESLSMLQLAISDGTTAIAATPHFTSDEPPQVIPAKCSAISALQKAAADMPIKIASGFEVALRPYLPELVSSFPQLTYIGAGRYVLLELPFYEQPSWADEVVFRLLLKGVVPIIAHLDRYPSLLSDEERLLRWVESGALCQINASAVSRPEGRRSVRQLLALIQRGIVHLVASDAHDTLHRPPLLSAARKKVAELFGEEVAYALFFDNPQAILQGHPLPPPPSPKQPRKKRWSWRVLFR